MGVHRKPFVAGAEHTLTPIFAFFFGCQGNPAFFINYYKFGCKYNGNTPIITIFAYKYAKDKRITGLSFRPAALCGANASFDVAGSRKASVLVRRFRQGYNRLESDALRAAAEHLDYCLYETSW